MDNSKLVDCDVCDSKVLESDWETHIDTSQHKEKALTQIMEDRLGKNRFAETRNETSEFLEELEQDFADKKK
jgi:hypothetical protein